MRHNWKSAQVHNPATGFRPPSAAVVSAEPFSQGTGTMRCLQKEMATYRHWSVSRGETQTMSHIVESCPRTKLNGGLSRLHSADEDTVSWLTSYGLWHAYEKKWFTLASCNRERKLCCKYWLQVCNGKFDVDCVVVYYILNVGRFVVNSFENTYISLLHKCGIVQWEM